MSKPEKVTLYWPKGVYFWQPRRKYAEGFLLEGQRHGDWMFWYRSGRKQMEGEYAMGKKTGLWVKWAEEGGKITEGNFLYGKMHGRWKDWYTTGQKALESEWRMGKRDGAWMYWETDGRLVRTEHYDHRYEEDKAYSVHTDLEVKEIVRQAHRRNMHRNWEKLVGRSVANLVQPWHVACWVLVFVPIFSLMKTGRPWRAAAVAGILAFLITGVLAWNLDRRK